MHFTASKQLTIKVSYKRNDGGAECFPDFLDVSDAFLTLQQAMCKTCHRMWDCHNGDTGFPLLKSDLSAVHLDELFTKNFLRY